MNILDELYKLEHKSKFLEEINHHRVEDSITLKVKEVEDIFNPMDASPLEERSLNRDVEDYILERLELLNPVSQLEINFCIPGASKDDQEKIKMAYTNHFKQRAKEQLLLNRKNLHKWQVNLLIGLLCLALCILTSHFLSLPVMEKFAFANVLSESLGILGWVAIWEPAEFFLFGRRENSSRLTKMMRLHLAEVNVLEE